MTFNAGNNNFHLGNQAGITSVLNQFSQTTQFIYNFEPFFHPFVGKLIAKLNQTSVAGMLDPSFLESLTCDYSTYYNIVATSTGNNESIQINLPAGAPATAPMT